MKTSYIDHCLSIGHKLEIKCDSGQFVATLIYFANDEPLTVTAKSFEGAIEDMDAAICDDWAKESLDV